MNETPASGPPSSARASTDERRLVTILFADLAGFASLAEHLDPEELGKEKMAQLMHKDQDAENHDKGNK